MAARHGKHRSPPFSPALLATPVLCCLALAGPGRAAPPALTDCAPLAPAARPAAMVSRKAVPSPRRAAPRRAQSEGEAAPRPRARPRIVAAPRPAVLASATEDRLPGCIPGAPPRTPATTHAEPPLDPAGVTGMTRYAAVPLPGSSVMALASVPAGAGGPLDGPSAPPPIPGVRGGPVPPTAGADPGPEPGPMPGPQPPLPGPTLPVVVVPEPGAAGLLLAALAALAVFSRRPWR